MAKKVTGYIKLQIPAGKATPAPPVGPALGQHGVNIVEFTKQFNAKTADMGDTIIPVVITVLDENTDIDARIAAGAGILNISAAGKTPEVVAKIREKYPEIPIIATGGPTRESIKRTIEAGANAISFTPPTAMDLFHGLMSRYRSEHESRTKEQTNE